MLEFDDNNVDCERDDKSVVFVRVGDIFGENDCDCGIVVEELVVVVVVGKDEIEKGEETGILGGGGRGISKISTISEGPFEFCLPPKNILFVDDVDTS
jgi:hypothetical protein